jgi:predicted helicase
MAVTLRELLLLYRTASISEKEKGWYFERLVRVWLENAPTQKDQFTRVITFSDFAKERGWSASDTGIDLMAQIAGEDDAWCAVQCKFYAEDYKIQKADIDSFFTASGKAPITRRLIVDSTSAEWGKNAKEAIINQTIPCTRIGLNEIEYSGIDWGQYSNSNGETVKLLDKKTPRTHQLEALEATQLGLAEADRGKLIMACGTGKTYTGLIIAQSLAGKGGRVLFLVPSLSLMSQTIREWSIDATIPLRSYAVCSDVQVGVNKAKDDDLTDIDITDLEIPATTSAWGLAKAAGADAHDRMTVVFSTYQSLPAVAKAQAEHGLPPFDLIICDEAHRTTGATLAGQEESNFVRVHDASYLQGQKRVYMTATPRVFGEAIKEKAGKADAALISMDDEALYGQTLFTRNFGWAVEKGLLTDYKVIVLAMDEEIVTTAVQNRIKVSDNKLKLDDATKMVGCYKALTKIDLRHDIGEDVSPVRRALAFARSIEASETFAKEFPLVSAEWRASLEQDRQAEMPPLSPKVLHVDGKFSANARNERLAWLKAEDVNEDACRILSNAKCLSEGVDVPALDAIMFLHPRKSQIDVVQSVGRVMRRAPGKKMGYVILPVVIPSGMTPEQALDKDVTFKVVWQVLNALRSHDERLDSTINKIGLGVDAGGRIEIIAEAKNLPRPEKPKKRKLGLGDGAAPGDDDDSGAPSVSHEPEPEQTAFVFDEFSQAIMAKIVKKCGTRTYWEDWAKDVARIAQVHITRIKAVVEVTGSIEANEFDKFLAEIRDDLNDAITPDEAIEMLAQHLITRPVFDALFEGYAFAEQNPVSKALEAILKVLDHQHLEKETRVC